MSLKVFKMSTRQRFIDAAKDGNVLLLECAECHMLHTSTAYFCKRCGASEFSDKIVEGKGKVVTYTIITVPPAGFEDYTPYAFVVVLIDGINLRISGFMGGIATPSDLPIDTKVRVVGYDERGLLIQRQNK